MDIVSVTGDFGLTQFRDSFLSDLHIDASNATWDLANIGETTNRYPFIVTDSSHLVLAGGTINGQVSLTLDWKTAYVNSAAVFARDSEDIHFKDWRISQAWDGIRITGHDEAEFEISNVWMSNIRDDGIENDRGLSGTIRDSMMDGVFVGISLYEDDTNNQKDQTVTLDNVLIRMESFSYKNEMTHQPFFKYDGDVSPKLSIHNSVFAIDLIDHEGLGRLEDAWDNVVDASNNYFLNLTDDPIPSSYPLPQSGFTILNGAEARAFWENARTEFVVNFLGQVLDEEPAPSGLVMLEQEFVDKIFDVFIWRESGGSSSEDTTSAAGQLPLQGFQTDNAVAKEEGPIFEYPVPDFGIDVFGSFDFV